MVKGVNICDVKVLKNPASFLDAFAFEITFACHENLSDDIEWKITYVGSAESEKYDQVLDSVLVGPVPAGKHMFTLEVCGPNPAKIPDQDVVGVTIVLITCSYREKEFIRVGYYVSNSYKDPELHENPPENPKYELLERNILASDPRVTRFSIDWGDDMAPAGNGVSKANAELVKERETDFEIQNKENLQMPPPSLAMTPASADPNVASKISSNKPESTAQEARKANPEDMDTSTTIATAPLTCS